jgi:hypothetical protein
MGGTFRDSNNVQDIRFIPKIKTGRNRGAILAVGRLRRVAWAKGSPGQVITGRIMHDHCTSDGGVSSAWCKIELWRN